MSMEPQTPKGTRDRSWLLRRGPMENLATVIIVLGILMLMQPFSIWAYGWSFGVILTGTVMFLIVSHFPD